MKIKITFDNVKGEYSYGASKDHVIKALKIIPSNIANQIRSIRFGRNIKTTQEGRIIKRGKLYEIKINFSTVNGKSKLLRQDKAHLKYVKLFGGVVDRETKSIEWSKEHAKNYSIFILFHEIGHIEYSEHFRTNDKEKGSYTGEELWCDEYAYSMHKKL